MPSRHFTVKEHVVPCQHIRNYLKSLAGPQEQELSLAVKQYTPRNYQSRHGDVTIIASHGIGFSKELYEPLWDDLLENADRSGFRIRNIWIADVANQGDSGVLNEGKIGNEPSYFDYARDLLHMVNHFRTEMIRPLVGIGHSMGGTVITNLALLHPRLFTSIIALEPIIKQNQRNNDFSPAYGMTYKKDSWPTRAAAVSALKRNPFNRSWDPRTLDLFLTHSLRETNDPSKPVTWKTTRDQEALTYARAAYPPSTATPLAAWTPPRRTHPDLGAERNKHDPFYRPESYMTFMQLPFVRPSVHYIYGAKTHLSTSQGVERELKLSTTGTATGGSGGAEEGRVVQTVVPDVGHFLTFEVPGKVAAVVGEWVGKEVGRWREEEGDEEAIWGAVERGARGKVEKEWHVRLEEQFGAKMRKMAADAKRRQEAKAQKQKKMAKL